MFHSNDAYPYGFRIVGPCTNERRLIDWPSAVDAYSQCDERAEVDRESYLSAFRFGDAFRDYLTATGSTKGYGGDCWAEWLWFDIDRDDIDAATADARRLAAGLCHRYEIVGDDLLVFFSGSKGFHVGLPLSLCGSPTASTSFHSVCRCFAESVAAQSSLAIDSGVYDRVRAFRAPNSRHPKTGRYKRYLAFDELFGLKASRIVELATATEPFDLPTLPRPCGAAVRDWQSAAAAVDEQRQAKAVRHAGVAPPRLNRSTMQFIRDGATSGDRHRLLFSAAANLAELDCPLELASELLTDAALDSGLSPSEVRRQIECGLSHKGAP